MFFAVRHRDCLYITIDTFGVIYCPREGTAVYAAGFRELKKIKEDGFYIINEE
jgi:hypothetical protein